jgi:hypothetical protein
MRSLWELDISRARCSSAVFPKIFICRLKLAQPWPQKRKIQRSRNAGFFCYNVTPLPENHCSTLFTTRCKWLTEGGHKAPALGTFALRLFVLGFCFGGYYLLTSEFGFLMWEDFWREKDCWRGISKGELLASLRAEILRKLKREYGTVQVYTENFIHRL